MGCLNSNTPNEIASESANLSKRKLILETTR